MAQRHSIRDEIHRSDLALFKNYQYDRVLANETVTINLNGTNVLLAKGSDLNLIIKSTNGNPNVYFMGNKIHYERNCNTLDIKTYKCLTFDNEIVTDENILQYLLLENGSFLLLENISKIIL